MSAITPGTHDARRVVVVASVGFAALLVAGGALILRARGLNVFSVFSPTEVWTRMAIGCSIGALAAGVCAMVVSRLPQFMQLRRLAGHAVEGIEPRWHTTLLVALSAGVSEEFFFRAALEPAIGRWFSGLAFVALHGALRLRSRGMAAFAVFLFAASLGLSALNRWKGIEAAMSAHAAYDLTMLIWLSRPFAPHPHA
jgi:membrane protease YdiL (CAAX protease family)